MEYYISTVFLSQRIISHNQDEKKATIPAATLPTFVAFNHQYLSVSSLLLLRISPNFSPYYASSPMCLSSRNRSIYKAFRHIMPCLAQVYKGMIYSKTGVP